MRIIPPKKRFKVYVIVGKTSCKQEWTCELQSHARLCLSLASSPPSECMERVLYALLDLLRAGARKFVGGTEMTGSLVCREGKGKLRMRMRTIWS
jgi:hypothetical protein